MTTRENVLSSELKRLLSGVSGNGALHLTEIETDLVQTTFLLGEAIEKLGASFMAIHEAVCGQQQLVDTLLAATPAPVAPELTDKLKAVQGEISQHVNAVVTGLQFQDMTSQLIGRTVRRVNGLRDVMAVLGAHSAGISPESGTEELIAWLDNMNKLLEDQGAQVESGLWKAVHQTHMDSGDIELF